MTATVSTLASEIETLQAEIKALDKAVAEATEQRKEEHATFVQAQAENQAATQLIEAAKNKLNKFYRPNQKKDGKSNGVMALMDNMANDLKSEHTESEHEEEVAQKDYEDLMAASQATRSSNAKSITEKESAKSEWSEKIENAKTDHASTTDALAKLAEYIAGLHASCDFLVENYGARKEARTNEIEGLKNAKAVLSGANFA